MHSFFARLDENTNCWEILRNSSKFFECFLKEMAKMHYFSIFFKKLTNHALNFRALGRKIQIIGKV